MRKLLKRGIISGGGKSTLCRDYLDLFREDGY